MLRNESVIIMVKCKDCIHWRQVSEKRRDMTCHYAIDTGTLSRMCTKGKCQYGKINMEGKQMAKECKRITDEQKDKVLRLHNENISQSQIAQIVGIGRTSVRRIIASSETVSVSDDDMESTTEYPTVTEALKEQLHKTKQLQEKNNAQIKFLMELAADYKRQINELSSYLQKYFNGEGTDTACDCDCERK